jgi:predicted amidohydrolase
VLKRFSALARKHAMWLVVGFVEENGGKLYNSAAVLDRKGDLVGIARKNFLWDCDNRWFAPGDRIAAKDTEFGRIGVLICADCRAPEIAATLVADGAGMLVIPTAWVTTNGAPSGHRNIHPEFLIQARAIEMGVPFVCCSKSGREGQFLEYVGQSRIVAADGRLLAEAPRGGEHLIIAEVEPVNPKPPEIDERIRVRLLSTEPAHCAAKAGPKVVVRVKQAVDAVADEMESSGARVARLGVAEKRSFAPSRVHAIEGAQVLVFQGLVHEDSVLRARAAENRVFAIAGQGHVQLIVGPDGGILYHETDGNTEVELDLAQADLKQFTPETDVWRQRRVQCYRLSAAADACERA